MHVRISFNERTKQSQSFLLLLLSLMHWLALTTRPTPYMTLHHVQLRYKQMPHKFATQLPAHIPLYNAAPI